MPRLLVQADDNALSRGVSLGILHAITHGIVRNTGLFTNRPAAVEAASALRSIPNICVGLDVNLVTGSPLSRPDDVPALVTDVGAFRSSGSVMAAGSVVRNEGWIVVFETDPFPKDQVDRETRAQVAQFTHIMGRKPDYLHFHSLATPNVHDVVLDLARELRIPTSDALINDVAITPIMPPWYTRPFPLQAQAEAEPQPQLIEILSGLGGHDTAFLIIHPGYVDAETLDLSTFSVIRARDLQLACSPELIGFLADHDIELVTYHDVLGARSWQ
ncbi:MAG: ChbG/HpnK family deacetylase [Propionicimonas sp.]